jgi:hypothetical protein
MPGCEKISRVQTIDGEGNGYRLWGCRTVRNDEGRMRRKKKQVSTGKSHPRPQMIAATKDKSEEKGRRRRNNRRAFPNENTQKQRQRKMTGLTHQIVHVEVHILHSLS